MVLIPGGLPGGDAESTALEGNVGKGKDATISETSTAGTARSPFRIFESAITCGETARLQQECDIGMAELSHMLAIFIQQLCSAAVIV
jgi:hypothetical protein